MLNQSVCCLLVLFCLAGCGGQPYSYQDANEMKPGPGLLSGKDGEFNLIRSRDDKATTKPETKPLNPSEEVGK